MFARQFRARQLREFLRELKRRNVFKVGIAYCVLAWLIVQVASEAFPALLLPNWATTLVTVLLIIGFPVALVLAWALELTPQGLKADAGRVGASESPGDVSGDGARSLKKGFHVGEWTAEPLRGQLVSGDTREHVEPRIMEVLIVLAENAGEVVERDALLLRVWGERAVTDEPLTRCVAELRRALGDTRKNPKFIQTIPKRGYRLVAPVSLPVAGTGEREQAGSILRNPLTWIAAAAFASAVLYVSLSDVQQSQLPIERLPENAGIGPPSIAVLPLSNRSNDADMEYFSLGVTEDIINLLATIPDLRVTSRTSSFHFRNKDLDLPAIARQLNVQTILEGSVRRQGDEIRVTVQLIDVSTDTQVDAFRFERPIGDLFEVQDEIAVAVANQLRVSLGRITERGEPTQNMRAHQLYLQARFESRKRTAETMNKAIELLEQAILIDAEFAAAYEELAAVFMAIPGYSQRPNDRVEIVNPKAMAAAQRAKELDPTLSKPYAILAGRSGVATDYVAARAGFERALALTPNDPEIRIWYGMMFSAVGDLEKAFEQFSWAHRVDPLSGLTNRWMGIGLWRLGRDEEARSYLDTAIALGDVNARIRRSKDHIENAEFDDAHQLLIVWARNHGIDTEWVRVYLAAVKNPARRDRAIDWVRELEKTHRDIGALTYADIGALDDAFASADKALANGAMMFLTDVPDRQYRDFRRDPRFARLVQRTGLIDYWNTHGWDGYCQLEGEETRCN